MAMLDKRCGSSDESDDDSTQHSDRSDSDGEVALDLNGRAHVDRRNNADGVYWSRADNRSVYTTFPMPGKASADALRKFLSGQLREQLITDEYGVVTGIEHVANDYLPVLQAKLWGEKYVNHNNITTQPEQSTSPEDEVLLAEHVFDIVDLLECKCNLPFSYQLLTFIANHIFVLPHGNKGTCRIATCLNLSHGPTTSPHIVALEPLIHWGTVTPATDVPIAGGKLFAFRRNSEKCDDPLWTMAIQQLAPKNPLTFCFKCLGLLREKRVEVCAPTEDCKMGGFQSVNAHHVYRRRFGRTHTSTAEHDAVQTIPGGIASSEAYANKDQQASMVSQSPSFIFCTCNDAARKFPQSSVAIFYVPHVRWNRPILLYTTGCVCRYCHNTRLSHHRQLCSLMELLKWSRQANVVHLEA